jgi:single-stranded-DNA-specific exonuclease
MLGCARSTCCRGGIRSAGTRRGRALLDNLGRALHAAGDLAIDRWQGGERVQMRLTDVAVS